MSETNEEAVLPMGLTDNPDEGGPAPWPAPGPMSDQRAKPRVVWKRVWKAVLVAAPFVVVKTLIGLGGDDKLRDYPDETERDETGAIVESGDVGFRILRVDDCVALPDDVLATTLGSGDEAVAFEKLRAVPCSDPHTDEVIHQDPNFWVGITEYPEARMDQRLSVPACLTKLDTYTGQPFETSRYEVITLNSAEATWKVDKGLTCIAITLDTNLTGAIEAAGSIRALTGTPTTDVGTIQLIDASEVGTATALANVSSIRRVKRGRLTGGWHRAPRSTTARWSSPPRTTSPPRRRRRLHPPSPNSCASQNSSVTPANRTIRARSSSTTSIRVQRRGGSVTVASPAWESRSTTASQRSSRRPARCAQGDDLRLGRVDGYFESPCRSRNVTAPVWIA